eukprot:3300592-Pleurochrysis_carterae.AAC.1
MAEAGDSGRPPVLAMLAPNARRHGHAMTFSLPVVVATLVSRANRFTAFARALQKSSFHAAPLRKRFALGSSTAPKSMHR